MKKTLIVLGALFAPFGAFAQNTNQNLLGLVSLTGNIVAMLIPIVSTLVIVFFFWGLAKYVLSAGDEEKAKEGKSIMIWGILALFVMTTIWGIIGFMQNTLGTKNADVTQSNLILPTIAPSSVGTPYWNRY